MGAGWRNWRGANELELITLPWCYKQIDNKTEAIESVFQFCQSKEISEKYEGGLKQFLAAGLERAEKFFNLFFCLPPTTHNDFASVSTKVDKFNRQIQRLRVLESKTLFLFLLCIILHMNPSCCDLSSNMKDEPLFE